MLCRPEESGSYSGFSVDLQQRMLSLQCLLRCTPSVGVKEGLAGLKEMSLEEAFAPLAGDNDRSAVAALLKAAVAALAQWGIKAEVQTTGGKMSPPQL